MKKIIVLLCVFTISSSLFSQIIFTDNHGNLITEEKDFFKAWEKEQGFSGYLTIKGKIEEIDIYTSKHTQTEKIYIKLKVDEYYFIFMPNENHALFKTLAKKDYIFVIRYRIYKNKIPLIKKGNLIYKPRHYADSGENTKWRHVGYEEMIGYIHWSDVDEIYIPKKLP